MCNALSLSSSSCFWKGSHLNTAGQNPVCSLLDLQDGWDCPMVCCVSGSSFSCLCCKQGLCSCVLSSTVEIPSLWQPPVTHCMGACLGRKRGREGKVHRGFKKLLSLPLNALFDTPQHHPLGEWCTNLTDLYSSLQLWPGFLQECRELHRMLSDIALQSETKAVLSSGKPKSASKNWEFGH